jgi:predicted nucleotidyltransferase
MNIDTMEHTIYLVKHGSHAYGLNTPESDLDIKGVLIPPKEFILGYAYNIEQKENDPEVAKQLHIVEYEGKTDSVIYGIKKFFQLAAECNPNIIEVLFCDEDDILYMDDFGRILRKHRDLFLSTKARHTFAGYAFAQLKRIKNHRAWLLDPPKAKPERADFGLPDREKLVNGDALGTVKGLQKQGYNFSAELMTAISKEKRYASALAHWKQYENWKKNRNPVRAKLEAEYGYDLKHAMHLIRLGRMCLEILRGYGVIVKRPDRDELLAIRNGAWTYDQVVEYAEHMDIEAQDLYKRSSLPRSPDIKKLNNLCMDMIESYI